MVCVWAIVYVSFSSLWFPLCHGAISPFHRLVSTKNSSSSAQERFLASLFDELWFLYKDRVPLVSIAETLLTDIEDNNDGITIDHIAFRTFGSIHRISHIFEALGYEVRGIYNFPKQHLTAFHYEHRESLEMPKLFLSELKVFELPGIARQIIDDALQTHCSDLTISFLAQLRENPTLDLLPSLIHYLDELPWKLPTKQQVEILDAYSQYAAWVLVHGYRVNHFAILVQPSSIVTSPSLESLVEMLQSAGLPMKAAIEGEVGSKLRQTSTQAFVTAVRVRTDDIHHLSNSTTTTTTTTAGATFMNWTYAYLEFTQRNVVDGKLYQGFLGPQATELFEMTRINRSNTAKTNDAQSESEQEL